MTQQEQMTLTFHDDATGDNIKMPDKQDPIFQDGLTSNSDLGDFLSRPIEIDNINWTVGSEITGLTINPWFAFFNNDTIKRKIENFARLNCKLHVRFVTNASPFLYGALLASYQPQVNFNPGPIDGPKDDGSLMLRSQRPHAWIYPQASRGAHMELPFLSPANWLDVRDSFQFTNMGQIQLDSVGPLRHANDLAGENVRIIVYAWATQLNLAVPTRTLAMQGGDEYDQEPGVVSGPASSVAAVADAVAEAPVIGPYARATSMLARGVSSLASLFGYTNTPVVTSVQPYRSIPFATFASPEISSPVDKLTLDPKNELTIDSRCVGLDGTDEMTVKSIVTRNSFLQETIWLTTDSSRDVLQRVNVTPTMWNNIEGRYSMTPMCHLGQAFEFWRGSIVVRLRVQATKFHKGRLLIHWEPNGEATDPDASTTAENFSRMWDIGETHEIEFSIPYAATKSWLRSQIPSNIAPINFTDKFNGSGGTLAHDSTTMNGQIAISVLTPLTGPVIAATVPIMMDIRGGDDLEFAGPRGLHIGSGAAYFTFWPTPSAEATVQGVAVPVEEEEPESLPKLVPQGDDDHQEVEVIPTESTARDDNLAHSTVMRGAAHQACMGEVFTSIRQLLHRTSTGVVLYAEYDQFDRNNTIDVGWRVRRFPRPCGFDPLGYDTHASPVAAINYVNMHPMVWFTSCYVGWRGSINWHVTPVSRDPSNTVIEIMRDANNSGSAQGRKGSNTVYTNTVPPYAAGNEAAAGMTSVPVQTQAGASVCAPMYSEYKFFTASPQFMTRGNSSDSSNEDVLEIESHEYYPELTDTGTNNSYYRTYQSAGPDFSLLMYLNVPTLYLSNFV